MFRAAAGAQYESRLPAVVDLHVDLSYQANYRGKPFSVGTGQVPAQDLLSAGVRGVVLPLYVPRDVSATGPRLTDLQFSLRQLEHIIPQTPPYRLPGCGLAASSVSTFLALEGADPLVDEPAAARHWVGAGVRLFGLVHDTDNRLASSSGPATPASYGLTAAGAALVRDVYWEGGLVDVSHASDRATDEILALAKSWGVAVVASHSNARRLAAHPRNLTDAQIRGIGQSGGIIGVNFHSRYLLGGAGMATVADVVRHIRYMIDLAGIDHIGIGSDFEGGIRPPPELAGVSGLRRLYTALKDAGLSERDIAKVFGLNALRVLCGAPVRPSRMTPPG